MWTRNPLSLSNCLNSSFPSGVVSISAMILRTIGNTRSHFDFAIDLNTVSLLASMIVPAHAPVLPLVGGGSFWVHSESLGIVIALRLAD